MNTLYRMARTGLIATLAGMCPLLVAAQEEGFQPLSSYPESLYVFNGYVYCSAEDGIHGRELWRVSVPEGKAELVRDITPGERGSLIDSFYTFKDRLYFRVEDPRHGGELWWSDGQPKGMTERLMRFSEGDARDGLRSFLGDTNGSLFFTVGSKLDSKKVYVCEGTRGSIRQFLPDQTSNFRTISIDGSLWEGLLFFHGDGSLEGTHRNGFWCTDGTVEGTTFLAPFDNAPGGFCAMGTKGVLFFAKANGIGQEPWFTKGTPESTRLLRDIWEGVESSDPADPAYLEVKKHPAQSRAFFRANHPEYGDELWETDGTPEGTKLAFDLVKGRAGSSPYKMTSLWDAIYFNARRPDVGNELWRLRPGSPWSVQLVKDINPGYSSSNPYAYCQLPLVEGMVFSAETSQGEELWFSGLANDDTRLLLDIFEGPGSSEPLEMTPIGDVVVFSAYHPVSGEELWVTNGNSMTRQLCDIYSDHSENPSSFPEQLTPLGDRMVFVADDIQHGLELWVTDGYTGGTELLKDIYPGPRGSQPAELTVVGDLLYFTAEAPESGKELYVTDGTKEGTSIIKNIATDESGSRPKHLTAWKGHLIFSATRPYEGEEPWIVRPGRKPEILFNIRPDGADSSPRGFVAWKDHVYFIANDGIHGEELWRTDGTAEGTVLVKDIVPVPFRKISYHSLTPLGDKLIITAENDAQGRELWVMDSERPAPRLMADIASRDNIRLFNNP